MVRNPNVLVPGPFFLYTRGGEAEARKFSFFFGIKQTKTPGSSSIYLSVLGLGKERKSQQILLEILQRVATSTSSKT